MSNWEVAAVAEVRRWAESAVRFPDEFQKEFGIGVGDKEMGRQDAYRAILGIIARHEGRQAGNAEADQRRNAPSGPSPAELVA